tara:strand:+ start:5482 stop:7218 length:1737 start_codon:yes stop_codon:yes gene_type:complete
MNSQNFFELALENQKNNNFEEAIKNYKKVLKVEPDHFIALFNSALIFSKSKRYKSAIKYFKRAIKIKPDNANCYNNLGNVYKDQGKLKESKIYYEKTIKIEPRHANAHYNLGSLYFTKNNILKAKECYQIAINLNPIHFNALFGLGLIFNQKEEIEKSIEVFNKAIKIQPKHFRSYNNLGVIYEKLGDLERAKTYYKKVLNLIPAHPAAHNNLANIYVSEGKNEEAVEHYKEALRFMPNNFVVIYHLSLLEPEIIDTNLKNNIKKNLKNKNIDKKNKSYANFLLSKYESRSKDYKKEIFYLDQAHQLYIDSEIEKLTPKKYWLKNLPEINFLNNLKCKINSSNINPIFIFGLPRSGSTLIENIIASSSENILVGEEIDIINSYFKEKILKNKNINFNDRDIQLDIINTYKKKNLIKNDSSVFTDKSLENFFFLDLIKIIFPNAKLVNCNRKSLSSFMSIFKNNLVNLSWSHNVNDILKYFNSYYEKIDTFKNKNPDMIYDIHYEKLVHNPEIETKKLLNFCGLEWNEKCLEFYKRKNLISKTTSNIQVRKPIYKNSSDRYTPYMKFFLKYKKKYKWLV